MHNLQITKVDYGEETVKVVSENGKEWTADKVDSMFHPELCPVISLDLGVLD